MPPNVCSVGDNSIVTMFTRHGASTAYIMAPEISSEVKALKPSKALALF